MSGEVTVDETGQAVFEFDNSDTEPVSAAVIEAVATIAGEDPLEIDPLHSVVDPDALDAIVGPRPNGLERNGDVTVSFHFQGYEVMVRSYGRIHVSEISS